MAPNITRTAPEWFDYFQKKSPKNSPKAVVSSIFAALPGIFPLKRLD